jgi:hypothetical protein
MTQAEAHQRCVDLQAMGGRDMQWIPFRTSADEWSVVRLRAPWLAPSNSPLGTAQEARPRADAPDTRPLVNPYWAIG